MSEQSQSPIVDDPEVVVLFTDVRTRTRVRAGLHRQQVRVAQPERLLDWVASQRPHVLLVTGDDESAGRARAAVVRAAPEAASVVLVDDPTPGRYRELLATCTAVLPTTASDEDVAVAVAGAWRALTCLPTDAARTLTADAAASPAGRLTLPPREVGWLRALAEGTTVAGLARSAGYSQREMYRLLAGLYEQLGTTSRTDALLRADRLGLLTSSDGARPASAAGARGPGVPSPAVPTSRVPTSRAARPEAPISGVPGPGRRTTP